MNVGALNIRFAEVNGTKENCCVQDLRKQKEPKPEISDFDSFFFCLMFSVTIFRPLTSARNYATIADRKRQIREVIFAGIFRNNRARKRIRTLIFHRGSYAHRLAQKTRFELVLPLRYYSLSRGAPSASWVLLHTAHVQACAPCMVASPGDALSIYHKCGGMSKYIFLKSQKNTKK